MSIRIMSAVWSLSLSDSDKLVLLALADSANDDGVCWPSMASLVTKCSKSDRTIQAAIKSLSAQGHLSRVERLGKGVLYTVHPGGDAPAPANDAAPPPQPLRPAAASPPKPATPTPEAASDKPSRTTSSSDAKASSERRRARKSERRAGFAPPHGVSDEQWAGFLDHRRNLRKSLTDRGYLVLCNRLAAMAEDGWPPGEMIDRATENRWTSVHPPGGGSSRAQRHPDRPRYRDPLLNLLAREGPAALD